MATVDRTEDGLAIEIGSVRGVVDWFWLRDHGEDSGSIDAATGQRLTDTFTLPREVRPAEVAETEAGFEIGWNDGTTTAHSWGRLSAVLARPHPPIGEGLPVAIPDDVELWRRPSAVEALPFPALIESDDALRQWLDNLHVFGFALATDVPPGEASVAAISERIGYVRQTIFGGIWELVNDVSKHADSAYGTTALEPHTDSTYSVDAPGLQIFCFQERSDEGGESVVVDGFALAADLSEEHRRVLASVSVPGQYVEPGVSLFAERPVLRCDSRRELRQVSFNNYDRAPFVVAGDQQRFYEAYTAFHDLVIDEGRWLSRRIEPGELLAVDNWRALHGRQAFVGRRRAFGAYLNHEDVASRRAVLARG